MIFFDIRNFLGWLFGKEWNDVAAVEAPSPSFAVTEVDAS